MASLLMGAVATAAAAPDRTRATACLTYMTELRPPAGDGPGEGGGSGRSPMSWMAGPDGQGSTRMSSPCFEPQPSGDFETSGQPPGSAPIPPASPRATRSRCSRSPMTSGRQASTTAGAQAALSATSGPTPKGSPVVTAMAGFIRKNAQWSARATAGGGPSLSGSSDPVGPRHPVLVLLLGFVHVLDAVLQLRQVGPDQLAIHMVRSLPEFVLRLALVVEIMTTHVRESLTFCAVTP